MTRAFSLLDLYGNKEKTGAKIEVFLITRIESREPTMGCFS